jgi:hypothetical protein
MDRCPALNCQSFAWTKSSGLRLMFGAAALSAGSLAQGLEIGAAQMLSGLGQPLSLQLPVRWAAGEARSADCLKLKVVAGDSPLAAAEVQQSLLKGADDASALIWVRSKLVMAEPVLVLSLGCPAQQVMALVDPVHSMLAPAGGFKTVPAESLALTEAAPQSPRLTKVRAERPAPQSRSLLRLGDAGLPPLTLADAQTPGLRWRFDSDLDGSATLAARPQRKPKQAAKEQPFYIRPDAPGASLLMAIDVGRAAGPADLLMAQDGPARLQRAQAQFTALQADNQTLKRELAQLEIKLAERDSSQRWLIAAMAGIAAAAALAAAVLLVQRVMRRRESKPSTPRPANISA